MATLERRPEGELALALTLRFWSCAPGPQETELHTVVHDPHTREVSAMVFRPGLRHNQTLATASRDATFKIWDYTPEAGPVTDGDGDGAQVGRWSCRAVGGYRDRKLLDACFASDGSVLAVLASTAAVVFDPDTLETLLVCPAPAPGPGRPRFVMHGLFLDESSGSLAAYGPQGVLAWDLRTGRIAAILRGEVIASAVDPSTGEVAVAMRDAAPQESGEEEKRPATSRSLLLLCFGFPSPAALPSSSAPFFPSRGWALPASTDPVALHFAGGEGEVTVLSRAGQLWRLRLEGESSADKSADATRLALARARARAQGRSALEDAVGSLVTTVEVASRSEPRRRFGSNERSLLSWLEEHLTPTPSYALPTPVEVRGRGKGARSPTLGSLRDIPAPRSSLTPSFAPGQTPKACQPAHTLERPWQRTGDERRPMCGRRMPWERCRQHRLRQPCVAWAQPQRRTGRTMTGRWRPTGRGSRPRRPTVVLRREVGVVT